MSQSPETYSAATCGQPVTIPGVFSATSTDLGHLCQRAAGHEGPHRWSARWEDSGPAEVEAELAADYEKWDKQD